LAFTSTSFAFCSFLTGSLAANAKNEEICFLGRRIAREASGELTLSTSQAYWLQVEQAFDKTSALKADERPPSLKGVVPEGEDPPASAEEARVFRTTLGKLAWWSLTVPNLQYFVSFLSTFQSQPTIAGMKALRLILRFAKHHSQFAQVFGDRRVKDWAGTPDKVVAVVDASWALKSSMGGYILWNGSMIGSWSRRIPVPCMSSAEAELFGLIEGLKEMQAAGVLIQSMTVGLDPQQEVHTLKMEMWSDSEAAIAIAGMPGLQRKVKHLELRIALLQYAVAHRGLEIHFVAGADNPADSLTKPSDLVHSVLLQGAVGMTASTAVRALQSMVTSLVKGTPGPKLERMKRAWTSFLLEQQGPPQEGEKEFEGGTDRAEAQEEEGFEASSDRTEAQGSEEVPFAFEDPKFVRVLTLPKRLQKALPHVWKREVARWLQESTRVLWVEVCCSPSSAMQKVCAEMRLPYLGLTEQNPVEDSVGALRQVLTQRGKINFWLSTPCTAGSPMRFLNHLSRWDERLAQHQKIWSALGRVFQGYEGRPQLFVCREWPSGNDLVHDTTYLRVARNLRLVHSAQIQRCVLDRTHKSWTILSNTESIARELHMTEACVCSPFLTDDPEAPRGPRGVTASGWYSPEVASYMIRKVLAGIRRSASEGASKPTP
jgi:hypothetical protein